MQRDENFPSELLMFFFEWAGIPTDDGAENFEQLGEAVVLFFFVYY